MPSHTELLLMVAAIFSGLLAVCLPIAFWPQLQDTLSTLHHGISEPFDIDLD